MGGFLRLGFIGRFVAAVAALGLLVGVVMFGIVLFGGINLSAKVPDPKIVYYALHGTFKRWVASNADAGDPPADFDDPTRIALGAKHYANVCSTCHGAPGLGQNPLAVAMKPAPQYLPAVVDQFSDEELHFILTEGVMMSAMPPWIAEDRPNEIWSVVAFLRAMTDMSAEEYVELTTAPPDAGEPIPFEAPATLADSRQPEPYPAEEHLAAFPSTGFTDHAAVGIPVAECAMCHGADGTGSPTGGRAPNLTVLSPDYIRRTLVGYATGDRGSGIMSQVASELSWNQIDRLATYYGDDLDDARMTAAAETALIERGEQIASIGVPVDGVPACALCHGRPTDEDGTVATIVPSLAGQNATYIEDRLWQFHRPGGAEGVSLWNPMLGIAPRLSDEDKRAVAAYFAQLEPGTMLSAVVDEPTPEQLQIAETQIGNVCWECHTEDMDGVETGRFPNLTLQSGAYVSNALWDFRGSHRNVSQMVQTAIRLSEDEIGALASFVGALEPLPTPGNTPDPELAAAGEDIARNGIPAKGIPACLGCHGEASVQRLGLIPHLHGQHHAYLEGRLQRFTDDFDVREISPMPEIATAMSSEEIAQVSAWFASQEPLAKEMASAASPVARIVQDADDEGALPDEGQPDAAIGDGDPEEGRVDTREGADVDARPAVTEDAAPDQSPEPTEQPAAEGEAPAASD